MYKHFWAVRKRLWLTQVELAKISWVDYNTLRKIERGATKNPWVLHVRKLCNALRITVDSLFDDLPKTRTDAKPERAMQKFDMDKLRDAMKNYKII